MKTIYIYTLLWIISYFLYDKTKNLYFFLIPYLFFIIDELLTCTFNTNLINAKERTSLFYDLSMIPTYTGNADTNYSEGYFIDGNYNITPKQAENQKFDMVIDLLNIKKGAKILTFGCGTCTMEIYLKNKGYDVHGLTLSQEQVNNCRRQGIKAFTWDMTKYNKNFENKFDHLIVMGSTEHIQTGCSKKFNTYQEKLKENTHLFNNIYRYLKKNGTIYVSGLHLNEKFIKSREMYVTDRMCGSTYTLNDNDYNMKKAAELNGLKTLHWNDITNRYYMITYLDNNHFGSPASPFCPLMILTLIMSLIFPPLIHYYEFYVFGYWMWGFDGKHHYSFNKQYSLETMENRPWTLWEGVFQK